VVAALKRWMDIVLTLIMGLVLMPFLLLIALLIGWIQASQRCSGRGG